MAKIEKGCYRPEHDKPLLEKKYIIDVFCLWNRSNNKIEEFLGWETMTVHCAMVQSLFAAKISDSEIIFLNTIVYKMGEV